MDDWLKRVIEEKGARCGNCGEWRILIYGHAIEECGTCSDEAFDIFVVADAEVP